MNKNRYMLYLMLAIVVVMLLFTALHATNTLSLSKSLFVWITVGVPVIFIASASIMTLGKNKSAEGIAQRFLIMTTFHFFAILILLTIIRYQGKENFEGFGLQFIVTFVVLMIINAILIVRMTKKNEKTL